MTLDELEPQVVPLFHPQALVGLLAAIMIEVGVTRVLEVLLQLRDPFDVLVEFLRTIAKWQHVLLHEILVALWRLQLVPSSWGWPSVEIIHFFDVCRQLRYECTILTILFCSEVSLY